MEKHGISFNEAVEIFYGPVFNAQDDRKEFGEPRYLSIGQLSGMVVVVVVHTGRCGRTRIISALLAMFD